MFLFGNFEVKANVTTVVYYYYVVFSAMPK